MPILIRGLRSHSSTNDKKREWCLDPSTWTASSINELFSNIPEYLKLIPKHERVNIYYTVSNAHVGKVKDENGKEKSRQFISQKFIPFDIDGGVKPEHESKVIDTVFEVLGLDKRCHYIVRSGHGIHILIELKKEFSNKDYFSKYKLGYSVACDFIDHKLQERGLTGTCDKSAFEPGRLLRLPGTINSKPEKNLPDVQCTLLQNISEPVDFDLNEKFGIVEEDEIPQLPDNHNKKYKTPDTDSVIAGCLFVGKCIKESKTLPEPEWFKFSRILAHVPNGRELFHKYSKDYPRYQKSEADNKINEALNQKPITCQYIYQTGHKDCEKCPYFNKVTSPVHIRQAREIATKDNGFHSVSDKGKLRPEVEDLRLHFEDTHPYVSTPAGVFVFDGKKFVDMHKKELYGFAKKHFYPAVTRNIHDEFVHNVEITNFQKNHDDWLKTTRGKVNFNNGVLDLSTMEMHPHSMQYAFQSTVGYDYNPDATCPIFEKFILTVCNGNLPVVQNVLEYMGYALSGDDCWIQQCMVLVGTGRNGKSTLLFVQRKLVGKGNYSSKNLAELKDAQNRAELVGKLVNIGEETPYYSLSDSSMFKTLVSGGPFTVKVVYKPTFEYHNRAKLIFACNEMPKSRDAEEGFFRRMRIVPFKHYITDEKVDHYLDKKLATELSGIFNLAIKAYMDMKKRGKFTYSEVIEKEMEEYKVHVDMSLEFFQENIFLNETVDFIKTLDIFAKFNEWVEERKYPPLEYNVFSKKLSSFLQKHKIERSRRMIDGNKFWGYSGISLKNTNYAGAELRTLHQQEVLN